MAHITGGEHLEVDEAAREAHQRGLDLAVDAGNFSAAHAAFDEALTRLNDLPPDSGDVAAQAARVIRDDGFTYLRAGLQASGREQKSYFMTATYLLEDASARTENRAKRALEWLSRGEAISGKERELVSEHGATRAVIGRKVIAMQVAQGEISLSRKATPEVIAAQQYFGKNDAHRFLSVGGKPYEQTSNAMRGALAERANGRPTHMAPWLGRAALALGKSVMTPEAFPAARTVVRIALALRSRRAALRSIVERP